MRELLARGGVPLGVGGGGGGAYAVRLSNPPVVGGPWRQVFRVGQLSSMT